MDKVPTVDAIGEPDASYHRTLSNMKGASWLPYVVWIYGLVWFHE